MPNYANKKDLAYQVITDRITQLLETGTVPWHKPWQGGAYAPRNLITKKEYRGINIIMTGSGNYKCPRQLITEASD